MKEIAMLILILLFSLNTSVTSAQKTQYEEFYIILQGLEQNGRIRTQKNMLQVWIKSLRNGKNQWVKSIIVSL